LFLGNVPIAENDTVITLTAYHFKNMKCLTNLTEADKKRIAARKARGKSHKRTKEQRQEMSKRMIDKWQDKEFRSKMEAVNVGRIISDETRAKMSKARTGKKPDSLARLAMSEAQIKRWAMNRN
jgi:hypothetical protein